MKVKLCDIVLECSQTLAHRNWILWHFFRC